MGNFQEGSKWFHSMLTGTRNIAPVLAGGTHTGIQRITVRGCAKFACTAGRAIPGVGSCANFAPYGNRLASGVGLGEVGCGCFGSVRHVRGGIGEPGRAVRGSRVRAGPLQPANPRHEARPILRDLPEPFPRWNRRLPLPERAIGSNRRAGKRGDWVELKCLKLKH